MIYGRYYKDGVLKGLDLALERLEDSLHDYDPGSSQRHLLNRVISDVNSFKRLIRDTKSYVVWDTLKG